MHTHGTKFSRQRIWRGTDRHKSWRCAFDRQPIKALQSMPLLCDTGHSLLIMRKNSNFCTDQCILMEQSLADRGYVEKLIITKAGGVHSTESRQKPSKLCLYYVILLIMLENSNYWMDRCTLMEQSLADGGDGEEQIDTKAGGVYSTYSRQKPSKICLYCVI